MGVKGIMKEKILGGNDGFISDDGLPEAPYWLMLAHKQLFGTKVLRVSNSTVPGRVVRVYAHCTKDWRSAPGRRLVPTYPPGAVTMLLINLDNSTSVEVSLVDPDRGGQAISLTPRDEYRFSGLMPAPFSAGNDTDCFFAAGYGPFTPNPKKGDKPLPLRNQPAAMCLNGKLLHLTDGPQGPNTTLPHLVPRSVGPNSGKLVLPALSYSMVVLPEANVAACDQQ